MKGVNWFFALTMSAIAHAVVIGALFAFHGGGEETDGENLEAQVTPPPAQTAETQPASTPPATPAVVAPSMPAPSAPVASPAPAVATPSAPAQSAPKPSAPKPGEVAADGTVPYIVKPGDTLTVISKKTGCTFGELAEMNGTTIRELAKLKAGQTIRVRAK